MSFIVLAISRFEILSPHFVFDYLLKYKSFLNCYKIHQYNNKNNNTTTMLFFMEWTVDFQNRITLWNGIAKSTNNSDENVKFVGKWWEVHGTRGVAIFESNCMESVSKLLLRFSPLIGTCKIEPIVEDKLCENVKVDDSEKKILFWLKTDKSVFYPQEDKTGSIRVIGRWNYLHGSGSMCLLECTCNSTILLRNRLIYLGKVELYPVNDIETFKKCIKASHFFDVEA